jgi:hypothetical protein
MAKTTLYVIQAFDSTNGSFEGCLMKNQMISIRCDFREFQFFTDKEKAKEFLKKAKKDIFFDKDFKLRVGKVNLDID